MRGIYKSMLCLLLVFCSAAGLCGCDAALEIDEQAYVLGIGLDVGKSQPLRYTFQVPAVQPQSEGSGGGGSTKAYQEYVMEARNIDEAVNKTNEYFGGKLNLSHLNFVVVSEALLSEYSAPEIFRVEMQHPMYQQSAQVVISRCEARDFLQGMATGTSSNLVQLQANIFTTPQYSGVFPLCTLYELLTGVYSDRQDALVAYGDFNEGVDGKAQDPDAQTEGSDRKQQTDKQPVQVQAGQDERQGGMQSELMGSVLLDDRTGKIARTFTAEQTQCLLMARGAFIQGQMNLKDPIGQTIVVQLTAQGMQDVKIEMEGDQTHIQQTVRLSGEVSDVALDNMDAATREAYCGGIREQIESHLQGVIEDCMVDGLDPMGYGSIAVQTCFTNDQWESINWLERLERANVTIRVEFQAQKRSAREG